MKPQLVKTEQKENTIRDKTIYDLELHEEMKTGNMNILRVPGGWIYTVNYQLDFKVGLQNGTQVFMTSTFVPEPYRYIGQSAGE